MGLGSRALNKGKDRCFEQLKAPLWLYPLALWLLLSFAAPGF